MNWYAVILLGLAGFLAGGAYSMKSQGKAIAMVVLIVLAVMAFIGGALYAWNAQ